MAGPAPKPDPALDVAAIERELRAPGALSQEFRITPMRRASRTA
jgi:hypothetical protein